MNKNKSLYQLIFSLTRNEKRFFKIYASRHTIGSENNYVRLFDLFDDQKIFSEEKINELAEKSEFVKYFSAEKNYLYNMILDCLDIYHKDSSVDRQISKLINTGRVLLEKKLDKQSVDILHKALKISEFHNRIENITTINQLLKKNEFAKESVTEESLNEFQSSELVMVRQLEKKLHYQHTFEQLLFLRRKQGDLTDNQELEKLKQQYPHLSETLPKEHFTFDVEVYYLLSKLEFHRLTRNKSDGRKICLRLIDFLENNRPKISGEYIDRYIYVLYVFVVQRLYSNTEEANVTLLKLRHLEQHIDSKVTTNEHARCFELYYNAVTDIFLESKNYHKVWSEIQEIERAFPIYEPHLTPTFILALHFNLSCLFFGLGEYRLALKWLNKVRNVTTPFREDIFYDLRTLNLIIHLELGNYEILPSLMKSALYYNKKHSIEQGIQKIIIGNFKQLLKAKRLKQKQKIYRQLREDFLQLKNNPSENRIFNDVDLIAWVDGKCLPM